MDDSIRQLYTTHLSIFNFMILKKVEEEMTFGWFSLMGKNKSLKLRQIVVLCTKKV